MNKGQLYEKSIREILENKNLLPKQLNNNDAGFIHENVTYYVEVKNKTAPDFGQKGLEWSFGGGWKWREDDEVSTFFDNLGVVGLIDKTFEPRRYTKPKETLSILDRKDDRQEFEQRDIPLLDSEVILYEFYARKQCYYIQVEGKGFYYMKQDIANLKVPRFRPQLTLRLRAKTHHSYPVHSYSFFAVLQANTRGIAASGYDLEEKVGSFPIV